MCLLSVREGFNCVCVKIDRIFSEWKTVLRGVPQGSLIGHLLFNIFS